MDFYPSISEKLLNEALAWASDLATITENDISIIKHARKSVYFSATVNYGQKKTEATVYSIVGLFILNHVGKRFDKENIGLYRDDGLAIIKSNSARLLDKTRK